MSGGAYDYLCFVEDAGDLANKREALDRMIVRLSGLAYAHPALVETERIAAALRRLDAFLEASRPLMEVWNRVEWWDSGDIGEDQVRAAAAEYAALTEVTA